MSVFRVTNYQKKKRELAGALCKPVLPKMYKFHPTLDHDHRNVSGPG